jgi:hypothetical protein
VLEHPSHYQLRLGYCRYVPRLRTWVLTMLTSISHLYRHGSDPFSSTDQARLGPTPFKI